MDLFTHLLMGLILPSLVDGQRLNLYLAAGIFMSLLPDLDFVLFPFWKRFPFTGHHGITHTPVFIFAASFFIYAALFAIGDLPDARLFLVLFLAGAVHILGDLLGTGGVPLLYPISQKYFKRNIDLGINPLLTLFSFGGTIVFIASYLADANPLAARRAAILLGSVFVFYYLIRAAIKLYQERRPENRGFVALPTVEPLTWKFASRLETSEAIVVSLKTGGGIKTFTIPKSRKDLTTVEHCEDLVYTYWHPLVQGEMRFFEFPCYRIMCRDGMMEIIWNSAEAGKVMQVHVTCEKGKCLTVVKKFQGKKTWF
jgi:membrane-bound metal-dependent hydrolase YbcI (DUF457 family)